MTRPGSPEHANPASTTSVLAEVLSSRVRAALLAWWTPRLDARASLTELSRATGLPISSVQHECYKLERLGLLRGRRDRASRRYAVQLDHPLARPLVDLTIAALGLPALLATVVAEAGNFDVAALASPPGDGSRHLLLLVGDADLAGLDLVQRRAARLLGIDPGSLELAYVNGDDWKASDAHHRHLRDRLAGRSIVPLAGEWPPPGTG